ncbi:unnamed protein product [Triticum turgidum subsp. durum]|uniref:C3H1-type domain-containing protein n=1 Tax=Triticum turgidum subsp. durum TaxID=4567 RepID=A0A9R0YJK4_TRITD|nr:unnamed protein product [Triticum turgidum subsp. durum]
MSNLGGQAFAHPQGRMPAGSAVPDGPPTPTVKTKLCNKYNTAEGCKWGDKCHFAHGERELGKHTFINNSMPPHMGPRPTGHFGPPAMPSPAMTTPAGFGASSTAKVSVDASLVGGIIGRGGVNTKQISRVTGAKLAIRDHDLTAPVAVGREATSRPSCATTSRKDCARLATDATLPMARRSCANRLPHEVNLPSY